MIDTFEKIEKEICELEEKFTSFGFSIEKQESEGCYILKARKNETKNHLIFQSGLHGIEGYVGLNMISYFVKNLLPQYYLNKGKENSLEYKDIKEKENEKEKCKNLNNYDFTFIINANPFGVKYKRRVNENNVDLNRNFLIEKSDFENIKGEYYLIDKIINPERKVKSFLLSYIKTIFGILSLVVKIGAGKFKELLLCGQKLNSKGSYYMGDDYQKQSVFLMNLYEKLFNEKGLENTVFIDLHTGYGPTYQMSIVNSSFMKKSENPDNIIVKLKKNYPLVVESNSNSFYLMHGDLIDFIYQKYPQIKYATAFEFGTFGDSLIAGIKSVVAVVLENQVFFNNLSGSIENLESVRKCIDEEKRKRINDKKIKQEIDQRDNKIPNIKNVSAIKSVLSFYEKAYFPKEKRWWEKAEKDFEMATNSIIMNS